MTAILKNKEKIKELKAEKEFYQELLQREDVRSSSELEKECRAELEKIKMLLHEALGYGKMRIELNLGKTPVALEERLKEYTEEDRYFNLQISLVRNGNSEKLVYLKNLEPKNGEVKFSNGFLIEHERFLLEFDKIIFEEFKLDWICDV